MGPNVRNSALFFKSTVNFTEHSTFVSKFSCFLHKKCTGDHKSERQKAWSRWSCSHDPVTLFFSFGPFGEKTLHKLFQRQVSDLSGATTFHINLSHKNKASSWGDNLLERKQTAYQRNVVDLQVSVVNTDVCSHSESQSTHHDSTQWSCCCYLTVFKCR